MKSGKGNINKITDNPNKKQQGNNNQIQNNSNLS